MEGNLFTKHVLQIHIKKTEKESLITHIQDTCGISLKESEITIDIKKVKFTVSSVVQNKLYKKNIGKILQQKGYTLE
jgi:uncharacterized protein (DUF486 family)